MIRSLHAAPVLAAVGFAVIARAEVVTLDAEADGFVYMASPDENYGKSAFLRVRRNPASAMKTYVRFDVGSVADLSAITGAKLSLSAYADNSWAEQELRVFGLEDGHAGEAWVEGDGGKDGAPAGELSWNNAPANDTTSLDGFTDDAVPLGAFKPEYGATDYQSFTSDELVAFLKADTDGKVTLMIATDSRAIQSIDARARPVPPRLEVTHDAP